MAELDEARWSAVAGRHRTADGLFVYAVGTTGVFCRPSCPSRRPLRRNVEFFTTPAGARRAGFRPCRRCRPETSGDEDPAAARVARACRLLEEADAPPELAALARSVGWSPFHLQRVFRRCVGVSPRQYADAVRLHRVKQSLRGGSTVTAAVYDAGYGSTRGFYEKASLRLGMTPSTYRAGAAGAVVSYTLAESSVGSLLVAATEQGLCSVKIGPDASALFENLRIEFGRADLRQADDELAEVGATVRALADGGPVELDLPLAVRGTAFQARVWEALRRIPAGTTRSYTEVASSIGMPAAVRAVANACGANPVALVVPCHRVVRTDGSLGGYRWGIEVKAELLRREAGRTTHEA
ncbi:MAG: bifunctional DNA-binding transcriptional regulator/O6-methylguanine-DNA methyltransferase Ada [Actinomycetota bacterium]|nr:bifunctional DNA-binding transcriptional regulator/O6-methylguanine-DNA methyltransferase Ada [Actinomycetota bacterium]